MKQRWDTDHRGHGIASAVGFAPPVERLLAAARRPDWPAGTEKRELRVAGHALVGSFSEECTHVAQRSSNGTVELDVITGMPDAFGQFAPHGHTVRLRIASG